MQQSKRRGIRLVEVLIAISIFVAFIGILISKIRDIRESANRMACSGNFKQLMFGVYNYAESHPSKAKTGALFPFGCIGPGESPEDRLSWMISILPYIEHDKLFERFQIDLGYAGNLGPAETNIQLFRCHSSNKKINDVRLTTKFAVSGIGIDAASQPAGAPDNGFMGYDRETTFESIKDGRSNTIALTETQINLGPWARGGTSNVRGFDLDDLPLMGEGRPLGGHDGGVNAAMADGSVRFIRTSIDPKVFAALVTIAGGEDTSTEWYPQ